MKTRTSTGLWLAMALAGNGLLGCVPLRDATGVVRRMIVDPQRRAVLLRRAGGKAGFIRVPEGSP